MGDQALQEAIQRARQLAAKISQSAPAIKRPASELDDHHSIGTVKVTLAYEPKPEQLQQSKQSSDANRSSNFNNNSRDNYKESNHMRDHRDHRDRDDRDRDSAGFNGSMLPRNHQQPPLLTGANSYSMLGGGNFTSEEKVEIVIPHAVIGLVIGKGGENIKRIQNETGATVRVDPNTVDEKGNKVCTITGSKKAVDDAHNQVASVIENSATNKRPRLSQMDGSDQYRMKIPASRTGAIIGKGGDTIKSIKQQSGCDIELDKNAKDVGSDESVFIIRGSQDKIQKAKSLIEARLASKGGRDGMNDRSSSHHNSSMKGVATGANAAPVAQFDDLPAGYPAPGQPASADTSAAWAAYFAQYTNLYSQAGAQPAAAAATGLPYSGQNFMAAAGAQFVPQQPDPSIQQQPQQLLQTPQQTTQATTGQQDYTDQWIEFYIANGRPDYAEQIREMKRQQQGQKQQPQTSQ